MSYTTEQLKVLQEAIVRKPPYCSGTVPLPPESFTLFYGGGETLGRIDLSNATPDELERLARACQPATFGLNQEDVLDETYRKAGKMDSADFSCRFDLASTGLVDIIQGELFEGAERSKSVRAELYKLNVYEKDSFFKAHKDTPRSDKMFGSLVIVFPTAHAGGALALRHANEEWTFDSAKAAIEAPSSVAYVAFYSDVEHEVQKVTSGYRVTLTYNLYFTSESEVKPAAPVVSSNEAAFVAALSSLLDDDKFLPDGGLLGFGLQHQYPVSMGKSVKGLRSHLKGSDALVSRVCAARKLSANLRILYNKVDKGDTRQAALDKPVDFSRWQEVDTEEHSGVLAVLKKYFGATILRDASVTHKGYREEWRTHIAEGLAVHWVTPPTTYSRMTTDFVAYGNQAEMAHLYGDLCLLVTVGKAGERATLKPSTKATGSSGHRSAEQSSGKPRKRQRT